MGLLEVPSEMFVKNHHRYWYHWYQTTWYHSSHK